MNVSTSTFALSTNSTPSSAIGSGSKDATYNTGSSDIPIAAIVTIVLFAYVVLMFVCIALVRCYCGKQCSNITCICCGNPDKVCCKFEGKSGQCCPNLPFASATACITCACCDQFLPKKDAKSCWKETDCVGLILCDKCLGPEGCCGQYYRVIEFRPHPVFQCDLCGGMDCHCNVNCDTINCLCFQIYRGGSMNHPQGQPYNNYNNNNAPTETVKQPPSLLTVSSTDSELGLVQTSQSLSSCSDVKSTQTPRDLYPVIIDLDSSRFNRSARSMKTPRSVAPHSDRQLFSPRNLEQLKRKRAELAKEITPRSSRDTARSLRNSNNSARSVTKSPKRMTTPINERSEHINRLDSHDSDIIDLEHEDNEVIVDDLMNSSVPGSMNLDSESTNKSDSSRVTLTRKLPVPRKSASFSTQNPSNVSSSVVSTNPSHPNSSLSYTTEALLAQYQLMDASQLTSASQHTT